ncbi:HIT family protein [Candidatus Woesearchaeota archaeon]|nr:HIT family protein [Candidatus Woesearchaeota archaeon]
MDDCIFCKIIAGEFPCQKVYENEHAFAFLDISPVNKGHCLVVPKKHYEDLLDMPDDAVKEVFSVVKKVSKAVIEGVHAEGFNVGMNNRKIAGQLVMHAHIHIMPRFKADGLTLWPGGKYKEGEAEETAELIKSRL